MSSMSIQEKQCSAVIQEAMVFVGSVQLALAQKRYEMIDPSKIDDLLERINTIRDKGLKEAGISQHEQSRIEGELTTAEQMLSSCKVLLEQKAPKIFMGTLLQKPFCSNIAYEGSTALPWTMYLSQRTPWIGLYAADDFHQRCPEKQSRLPAALLENAPPGVKQVLATAQGKSVDFIFDVGSMSAYRDQAKQICGLERYNIATHPWTIPRMFQGDDIKKFPEMGIFQPIGVFEIQDSNGVPFDKRRPLEVYVHPKNGGMALSPNTAWFGVSDGAPVSSFWFVVDSGDKVLVLHQWLINQYGHPFSKYLSDAVRTTDWIPAPGTDISGEDDDEDGAIFEAEMYPVYKSVGEHIEMMKQNRDGAMREAMSRFGGIQEALAKNENEKAMALFDKLSEGEKNRIYYFTWVLQGKPNGVHPDFGKASFLHYHDLSPSFHASNSRRAEAIEQLAIEQCQAFDQLVDEHLALFTKPKAMPPVSPERLRKEKIVNPIIAAFKSENTAEAMRLFDQLPESDKGKIFEMAWDYKGCPKGIHHDFGKASFLRWGDIDPKKHCSDKDRLEVVILYLNQSM